MVVDSLLVTSYIGLAGAIMGIIMIFSLDQRLYLGNGSVELQPLFVDGLGYTVCCDSRVLKPRAHCINSILVRGEYSMDLFRSIMLCILR